jgi:hypothetical protein
MSQLAFAIAVTLPGIDPAHDLAGTLTRQWPVWLVACYLPALAFVLRRPAIPATTDRSVELASAEPKGT